MMTITGIYARITYILKAPYWLNVRKCIDIKILLTTYNDIASEIHPEKAGHRVKYYCRYLCLSSSDVATMSLVSQPLHHKTSSQFKL